MQELSVSSSTMPMTDISTAVTSQEEPDVFQEVVTDMADTATMPKIPTAENMPLLMQQPKSKNQKKPKNPIIKPWGMEYVER